MGNPVGNPKENPVGNPKENPVGIPIEIPFPRQPCLQHKRPFSLYFKFHLILKEPPLSSFFLYKNQKQTILCHSSQFPLYLTFCPNWDLFPLIVWIFIMEHRNLMRIIVSRGQGYSW